jgi:hypothetical protein
MNWEKMSDYITWDDLKIRWDKLNFQLLEYIQKRLQPYSRHGIVVSCPFRYHKYSHLHNLRSENKKYISNLKKNPDYDNLVDSILPSDTENGSQKSVEDRVKELERENLDIHDQMARIKERDPHLNSWKNFVNPKADGFIDIIISDLKETIFKVQDVLEFEEKHRLGKLKKKKKLLPCQKAQRDCRKVAKKLRDKYPNMPIFQMKRHPEIMEVGKEWADSTRHRWICDLFPEHLRKPGRKRKIKI